MRFRGTYLYLILLIAVLSGCTADQKLARQFVKLEKSSPLLIMPPSLVYKINLKTYEIPDADSLDPQIRDSILLENSLLVKFVDDSLMISAFKKGLKNMLGRYRYNVLDERSLDSLMAGGHSATIIHLVQFMLEEFVHPFSSEEVVYDEILVIDGIDLNAINYNAWIEVSSLNGEDLFPVLFTSDYHLDTLNGILKQNLFSGKFSFDYTIDTLQIRDLYAYAEQFGQRTGALLFDYLMNRYVLGKLPENYLYEPYYLHYDINRRLIYPVEPEERIIELK